MFFSRQCFFMLPPSCETLYLKECTQVQYMMLALRESRCAFVINLLWTFLNAHSGFSLRAGPRLKHQLRRILSRLLLRTYVKYHFRASQLETFSGRTYPQTSLEACLFSIQISFSCCLHETRPLLPKLMRTLPTISI